MKNKGIGILLVVILGIFMGHTEAEAVVGTDSTYTYDDDGIVEETLELSYPVIEGENYDVTIYFTGLTEDVGLLSFGYNEVTDDQMVPNVYTSDDRSGLCDEKVFKGIEEVRTFGVAAMSDKLTITATGSGKVTKVQIVKKEANEKDGVKIITVGDSLVQTYSDTFLPQTGWGQVLQEYFTDDVTCVNYALGGRSSGSYLKEGRFNEVLLNLNQGDYVFIEFGHNDATKSNEYRFVDTPEFEELLKNYYVKGIRQRGGIPVFVTLANRNDYQPSGQFNVSFERYVDAMKRAAEATDTYLIDLNTKTVDYFTYLNKTYGIGITESIIFNYAKPGEYTGAYSEGVSDNTHYQGYGARIAAGLVAEGVLELELPGIYQYCHTFEEPENIPSAPTGIKKKYENGNINRIVWDVVQGADFYKVLMAKVIDGEVQGEYEVAGYTANCDYLNGDAFFNQDYAYKVIAINGKGESLESEVFMYKANIPVNSDPADYVNVIEVESAKNSFNIPLIGGICGGVIVFAGAVLFVLKNKKKR